MGPKAVVEEGFPFRGTGELYIDPELSDSERESIGFDPSSKSDVLDCMGTRGSATTHDADRLDWQYAILENTATAEAGFLGEHSRYVHSFYPGSSYRERGNFSLELTIRLVRRGEEWFVAGVDCSNTWLSSD
jgi:hypothetical protein